MTEKQNVIGTRPTTWLGVVVTAVSAIVITGLVLALPALTSWAGSSVPSGPADEVVMSVPQESADPPVPGDLGSSVEDGFLPAGATIDDTGYPGLANLDSALRQALREASAAATAEGVRIDVVSGWRSAAYQQQLLDDAVDDYGSREEAARWVATPDRSLHVSGDAVDVGFAAAAWLDENGAAFGLCRIYDNESWHFELRPDAPTEGCPALFWDPTYDPRLQE